MTEQTAYLATTADAYDSVATLYADLFRDALDGSPLDRAVLAAFAEFVRGGAVAELGCGPGAVTAHLRDLGLDVFGVDLSPAMIGIAREAYPELRFEVGSMEALDALGVADGALRGILSWYSLIHVPPEQLPAYFAEFRRVIEGGGHLLLGFFEAEGDPVTPFDHKVTTAYRWPVDALAGLAAEAGFVEVARMLRQPGEGQRFRQGCLLMRQG
ncbi:methyltransferase domain-containing protein [Streptomyces sp. NBC_00237]|uniref:class I SAM-dependent methyltransferase n=1 Tax=Streptomyces sp. NBC_00237 TaxID=2975687 RepID=UPI002255D088|nr:class I SAM-dependent methyltransferase [Streptomyces sp. NBC_00237]MCX5205253.1 methyltransferase domain-containing protein [Streptomyces sp. NBC_00237]